jgi:hypothetical protein
MDKSSRSSRRALLYGMGMGGLGVATSSLAQTLKLGTSSPLATVLPRVQTTVRQSALEGWAAAVGSIFTVVAGRTSSQMTLISAKALDSGGTSPADLRPIPFALVFQGNLSSQVPAGNQNYVFQNSGGTNVTLFVGAKVPAGTKAQLVAILN